MKPFLWIIAGLLLALFASSALAIQVQAPNQLTVSGSSATLEATVLNDSASELPLKISLFAPSRFQIQAPSSIAANRSAVIKITFDNFPFLYNTTYETQLQVVLGSQAVTRKILVSFQEPNPQPQPTPNPLPNPTDSIKNAFNGFVVFLGTTNAELALQIVLVIVVVVLCVALIARLYNRAKGEKK